MAFLAAGPGLGSRSHRGPETQGEGQGRDTEGGSSEKLGREVVGALKQESEARE